ncbi:hypothetical protein [Qipengyuania sp.]
MDETAFAAMQSEKRGIHGLSPDGIPPIVVEERALEPLFEP